MCALRGHAKVIIARARLERTGTGNGGGTRTDSDDDGNPDEWAEGAVDMQPRVSIFRHDPIVQTLASAIKDVGGYAVAEESAFFSSVLPPAAIAAAQAQAALTGQSHRLRRGAGCS
ncbi:hypothetical protein T492DRAFT_885085 [Pavlovales sp. CCMP2436]|nr:hypothetical protein T492DRAFT_885085 [Pavlovales sp. CCMP2436]